MRTNYITYSILDPLSVAGDGLQLTAQTYATNTLLDWPAGTKVVLQVQASGRQLTYSTPPSHRDAKMLTWSWTLAHYSGFPDYPPIFLVLPDNPSNFITGVRPKPISVTVPLGPGEHLAALVQYGQLNRFKQIDGHYYVNIGLSLESLLPGWLGFTAATLSLLFLLRRYFRGIRIRLCSLAVALLAPTLPLLGYISVNWNSSITPIPAAIALLFTLFSILFFRRVLRSVPLRDHQPALTGRRAGIGSWLPLASLPVAAIVVAVALFPPARIDPAQPDGTPPGLLTVLDIIVASTLVWAVSILVLTFTRTSLRAISVWTTSEGSLADTGAVGAVVARCYHLATGAVVAVSAYAVGYGLAKPLGEAVSAYRVGAASAASASGQFAAEIANIGVYPAVFLLLPVTAALAAAAVSSTISANVLTVGVVAVATLAWATTSRAIDLDIVGASLPVGAWVLTALITIGLRARLRGNVGDQAEPWLPVREPSQTKSSRRATLRVRLGRWLARVEPEMPKDLPLPGTIVARGPFRDARSRANLALAWGTLLSVIPVGYLVWGTLTALPRDSSQPTDASLIVSQAVAEVVRWALTAWLYGLLMPVLKGRVGPVKALWLSGAWFVASAPVALIDIWTGADQGRVWLFPGLQLLLFLTALAVLMDLSTVHAWAGAQQSLGEQWSTLLKVYNFEDARKVIIYAAPAIAAVIAISQQVISGSGLDFVNSLLSQVQSLLGGR